jgi:hypothetical protein
MKIRGITQNSLIKFNQFVSNDALFVGLKVKQTSNRYGELIVHANQKSQ